MTFSSSVSVVGGGTAGWLAALMLNHRLNRGRQGPPIRVRLIESPTVPTIGVGEGSLIGLAKELERLGIPEGEFMRRCNATFKLGVRFVDWNADPAGKPYTYIHPVSYGPDFIANRHPLYHFLAFGALPGRDPHTAVDSLDAIVEAIQLNRAPRIRPDAWYKGALFNYGYHFDAASLAEFLREVAVGRGVEHIVDDVDDAIVGEGETISHLKLRSRGLLPVDLVVDCTGFAGVVISKVLKEPFESYSSNLLCDRAVPIQVPYQEGEQIGNSTSATALTAGWVWRIPLFNRVGTGYVFSSAFTSDDEAVRELCRHLRVDPDKQQPRVIRMRVGRVRRAWVGNCVAVGLSGGFVEPLEATAIMTSMMAAFQISHNYPSLPVPEGIRAHYNRLMAKVYDGVRDFIVMHYYLATRNEPFWRAARSPSVLPDVLRENLELWQHRLPEQDDLQNRMFSLRRPTHSTLSQSNSIATSLCFVRGSSRVPTGANMLIASRH